MKRLSPNSRSFISRSGAIGLLFGALVLGGCGPAGGDDDATREATQGAVVPTQSAPVASPTSPPTNQPASTPAPTGREQDAPAVPRATPVRASDDATPAVTSVPSGATRVAGQVRPDPTESAAATPAADEAARPRPGAVQGDGTTGAAPTRGETTNAQSAGSASATVDTCERKASPSSRVPPLRSWSPRT